jgi:ribose 5-phosphate isomerase
MHSYALSLTLRGATLFSDKGHTIIMEMTMTDPHSRGERSESLVQQALKRIIETGLLKIIEFKKSEKYSPEDRRGKDFIITTDEGEISLDVKSSDGAAKRFVNKGKQHHNVLPVIVVYDHDNVESVVSKLVAIIKAACHMVKRQIEKMKGRATIRRKKCGRICHQNHAFAH